MALLSVSRCYSSLVALPFASLPPSSPRAMAAAASFSGLPITLSPTSPSHFAPFPISKRGCLPIRAASDVDGPAGPAADGAEPPPPGNKEEEAAAPVEKLPLESKLQERMEQKLRMKMAKKIQLRRKRLLRKRRMRKKGRWPPSKMKKLKNV